jgi:hypothetical protein
MSHRIVHGDDFGGVDDFYVKPLFPRIRDALPLELCANLLFLADQKDARAQIARCGDCTFNFDGGGMIPTHCVNGDSCEHGERKPDESRGNYNSFEITLRLP